MINPFESTGAVVVAASSGNVAAGTCAATLAATSGFLNYVTGFTITASGATSALAVDCTLTGVKGGTQTYTYTAIAGVTLACAPLVVTFPMPIPASAVNTAITISMPTLGSGAAHAAANIYGLQILAS